MDPLEPSNIPSTILSNGQLIPHRSHMLVDVSCFFSEIPSLKLTAKAPENEWLEDYFPFGMVLWISRKLVMILLHISHSSAYQHPSGFRYATSGRQDQGACYKLNNNDNDNTQDKPQTPTRTKTLSTTITTTNYCSKHARDQLREFAHGMSMV